MNSDEIKSALGQIATAPVMSLASPAVMAPAAVRMASTAVAELARRAVTIFSSAATLVPAVLLLANIAGSIWRHWNMKKVPETAIVVKGV